MPIGIVRASDRVAVWHEAAEGDFAALKKKLSDQDSSCEPPSGVTPELAGQDVAPKTLGYPNSNKFKTPANALKKHLENSSHPSMGFSPEGTKGVEDWAAKYPDFTKNYLKPQHEESLKSYIGEENHAKFLHHAPTPYTDALTKHEQKAAPNSNKFKTPFNQLKKVLDDPNTQTTHVQELLKKHPDFAKTYLKPNYQDALKGLLGDQKYKELQNHLTVPEKAQEKGEQSSKPPFPGTYSPSGGTYTLTSPTSTSGSDTTYTVNYTPGGGVEHKWEKSQQKGLGDKLKAIGLHPSNEAQAMWNQADPHHMQNTVLPNLLKYHPQDKHEQIKQVINEHFGVGDDQDDLAYIKSQMPQTLGDKLKGAGPNWNKENWDSLEKNKPEKGKELLEKWLFANPTDPSAAHVKKIYDEHFGDKAQSSQTLQQALTEATGHQWGEGWADADDYNKEGLANNIADGNWTPEQQNAMQKVYEHFFGGGQQSTQDDDELEQIKLHQEQLGPSTNHHYDNLINNVADDYTVPDDEVDTFSSPEFKAWFNDKDTASQANIAQESAGTVLQWFKEDQGEQFDDDEDDEDDWLPDEELDSGGEDPWELESDPFLPAQQPSAPAAQQGLTHELLTKYFPHLEDSNTNHWIKDGDVEAQKAKMQQQINNFGPGGDFQNSSSTVQKKWEDLYNEAFGAQSQQQAPHWVQQVDKKQLKEPAPGIQHPALAQGVQKIFPDSQSDFASMDDATIKKHLESWLKYLPETPGYENHLPQLQKLYDQYFGQGQQQQQPSVPGIDQEPLQGWEQELLDQSTPPDKYQNLLDKINAIKPGWLKQKSWLEHQDKANQLQKVMQGWTQQPGLSPKEQAAFQILHDEHFGGGGQSAALPGAIDKSSMPSVEQLVAMGIDPKAAKDIFKNGPQLFWDNIDFVKKELDKGDPDGYYPSDYPWTKIVNWHNQQQEMGSPSFKPLVPHPDTFYTQMPSKMHSGGDDNYQFIPGLNAFSQDQGITPANMNSVPFNKWSHIWGEWDELSPQEQQYFIDQEGAGQQQASPSQQEPSFNAMDLAKEVGKIVGINPAVMTGSGGLWKEMSPEVAQNNLKGLLGSYPKLDEVYDKYFGEGQQQKSQFDKSKTPTADEMMALGISSKAAHSLSVQEPDLFWKNYDTCKKEIAKGEGWKPPPSWQEVIDKLLPGQGGGIDKSQTPSFEGLKEALGNDFGFASSIAKYSPQKFWDSIDLVKAQIAKDGKAKNPIWGKIVDWIDNQGGQQQQPQGGGDSPHYQKWLNAFIKGPNSTVSKGIAQTPTFKKWFHEQPPEIQQKFSEAIGNGGNLYGPMMNHFKYTPNKNWSPEWTQAKQESEQGIKAEQGGDGYNDDISAIQDEIPEVPPEPAKAFKGEQLNPEDLANWTQNKPQSPADWKSFSQWWGDTQVSPEDEQALYSGWFGKDATPEQANSWFQQVFEHNSNPSEGDMGVAHIPSWAHNSWAFGQNADKEWPVFKEWATKHPGIPKGTSLKQKVQIWNGLSPADKSDIAAEFLPEAQIDTKSVIKELQAAFPESNWSKWKGMTQSALQKNVEGLAKSGHDGAIPIFNKYFGGDLPVPEPKMEQEQAPEKSAPQALPPPESLPPWIQPQLEGKQPGQVAKLTKEFLGLANWAQSIGQQDAVLGEQKPNQLGKIWNDIPDYLKGQIAGMDSFPWHDLDTFNEWKAQQPTPKDAVQSVLPNKYFSYHWGYPGHTINQQQELGKFIKEADPATQQKLLAIQSQYFVHDKTTLAEGLKEMYPEQDWDKLLQKKSGAAATFIKKQLKEEKDPVKWAQLANLWAKHFPHPEKNNSIAPTGIKALTDHFKYNSSGAKDLNSLALHKAADPDNLSTYFKGNSYYGGELTPEQQQQITDIEAKESGRSYLPYLGWTPPSDQSAGFKGFTPDPAMMIKPENAGATYSAPPEITSEHYQTLMDKAKNPQLYSDKDRGVLKSEGFRNWFAKAPKGYQQSYDTHPGIALDDYAAFMGGDKAYGDAPESAKSTKYIDVSPFANIPKKNKGKGKEMPSGLTHNPQRSDQIKFPRKEDQQETIPLPAGEKFAPDYAAMPIYRVMRLKLDNDPGERIPSWVKGKKNRDLHVQQQKSRLRQIDEIINGGSTKRTKDVSDFDNFADKHGLDQGARDQLALELFRPDQPDLFSGQDEKWQHLQEHAKKYGIPYSELADLAKKMEVEPEPEKKGNYDHPDLADLILDYFENGGGTELDGGLGFHWTRDIDKAYNGVPAAGQEATTTSPTNRDIPVSIHGLWSGQGEGTGEHGAYEPHDKRELEQNLRNHAPVNIRRLQIRSPDNDWHDLMDHGPISNWDPGRNETGSGHKVYDKPSLAVQLDKVLGGKHAPQDWDTLKPGHQAEILFSKLIHENPHAKDKLLKEYQRFFVGRPDLPTKPHQRRASLSPQPALGLRHEANLDERNPAHLFDLASSWGIANPERYGLPAQVTQRHGKSPDRLILGPRNSSGSGLSNSIQAAIEHLATAPAIPDSLQNPHWLNEYDQYDKPLWHYQDWLKRLDPDELEAWGNADNDDEAQASFEDYLESVGAAPSDDDDYEDEEDYDDPSVYEEDDPYEFSDDDFNGQPPEPAGDRPAGWPKASPLLNNDPRGRQYFPPHGLNPPSTSQERPDLDWDLKEPEQDFLPTGDGSHEGLGGWDKYYDRDPKTFKRPTNPHFLDWLNKKGIDPTHQDFSPSGLFPDGPHGKTDWNGLSNSYRAQNAPYEWPHDPEPIDMHRGFLLDLRHPDLAHVRRALHGGQYEDHDDSSTGNKNIAKPHPAGYDNPNLGEHILNHLKNNPRQYENFDAGHYGPGPHWSTNPATAQQFANQTSGRGNHHPLSLPTVVKAKWKGAGEDPYRTNTQGDWPEEEVTMLPGAKMDIHSVQIQHPKTKQWHEVLGQPAQHHASVDEMEIRILEAMGTGPHDLTGSIYENEIRLLEAGI